MFLLLEGVVAAAALWLNATRTEQGSVVVDLSRDHGVHKADVVMVALMVAVPIAVFRGGRRQRLR